MKLLIDSSEKAPWHFSQQVVTEVANLPTGDYSIEGHQHTVCVERKSLPDLVHTVIHDKQRFARQLRRMAAMDLSLIVVEAPVTALITHQYSSDATPASVRGRLNSILLQFGIHTLFLDNPTIAADWVENLFRLYVESE